MVHFGSRHTRDSVNKILKMYNFEYTSEFLLFQMACILQCRCNFLHRSFRCCLPVETVDVEVTVTSMQGIHTFRRDRTCQIIKCNLCSTRLHPHTSLIEKMRTYLELEGKLGPKPKIHSQQNQSRPAQPNTNLLVRRETKATDKRRKPIPTKGYKVWVVANLKPPTRLAIWSCKCPQQLPVPQ